MKKLSKIIKHVWSNLTGQSNKHYCAYYFCVFMGIISVLLGICTHTKHNIFMGVCVIVFGRMYLNADMTEKDEPFSNI